LLKPYQNTKWYGFGEISKSNTWTCYSLAGAVLALSLPRNATLSGEGPSPESVALRDRERARTGLFTRLMTKWPRSDYFLNYQLLIFTSSCELSQHCYLSRTTLARVATSVKVFRTVLFYICALSFCHTDSDRVTAVVL